MAKIKVVTDSTIDLTLEEAEKYGIEMIPLCINIDNETYLDRVELTPTDFIEKMKNSKELPKSSQPAIGSFVEVYERLVSEGYDVISIHMTGGMSGTVRAAESAAQMVEGNITVVDSMYITKALSFQVFEAVKMIEDGHTVEEIVTRLEEVRQNTNLFVVVDTLENLVKGGRIGRGKGLIGSLLNIKPIASLADGVYTPVAKVRSHSQVVKFLTKQFEEHTEGKSIKGVGLVHADGFGLASKLKESIVKARGYTQFSIEDTTPIISTHTGIGAIGFMYFAE
ncbi:MULTISPECIES: DegV family protein [Priestia]|jgi:DegV family protein with EDD domain|uniref:DegV family protein n=1 Tax=Priestia TaxID=2800373 RepID=UPI000BF557B0|nr:MULTISPECIES: DegV family protein [Priestia]RCX27467.1 DegV family protein with EDD domain [Bacillus sp. AG236]MBX9996085.1 DegV family protein [Priestia aryabhattai]MCM3153400.1 DegV family protein [Priestia megaterium]MCP1448208.1 DegV family protein with EDD domain [Priestia megaterium]MCU7737332.1 DegV family protein [Priestia megaterium]